MIGLVAALPRKRGGGGAVRPPRRPARARGRRVVPRARLPARGDADARDVRLDRAARARRPREGAAGDRQDDRGEDRPDRRGGRDRGAREAASARFPPEVVLFMRLPGLGPKTAARIWQELGDHDARRAEGAPRRASSCARCRARREERGEDPQGARVQGGEPGRGAAPARRRPAGGAGGRLGAARASGRGARLGGRLGAAAQGDVPRPRHHRDRDRPGAS